MATTQQLIDNIQSQLEETQKVLLGISEEITKAASEVSQEEEESIDDSLDADLMEVISDVTDARIDRMTNDYILRIKDIERVNVSFEIILANFYTNEEIDLIMDRLNFCRRTNDFGCMRSVYELYKDVPALRELMKAVCAMYRLNVKDYADRSASSGDRSIVKYTMACPECGEMATALVNTMASAGLKM